MAWHKGFANGKLMAMRMRGHRYALTRLVSAVAVVALVFANVIGAYAHAGAHGQGTAHAGCDQHHEGLASVPDATQVADRDSPSGTAHEHGSDGAGHLTSCDFACHGGVAILGASDPQVRVSEERARPQAAHSVALQLTGSLERPPRPSVRA